jgi:hypothetical protein
MKGHLERQRYIDYLKTAPIRVRLRKDWKTKPDKGDGGETVPVEPNRPKGLEGGAAAALEFDD